MGQLATRVTLMQTVKVVGPSPKTHKTMSVRKRPSPRTHETMSVRKGYDI